MSEPLGRIPTAPEVARLRLSLQTARFTDAAVCERLGISSIAAVEPLHAPAYQRRLNESDPQAALIRLFLLQGSVQVAELLPAFGEDGVALLVDLGLVEREGDWLAPQVDLYPYDGDWFATDRSDVAGEGGGIGRHDAVMPLNMSSHTLAQLVLPSPAETALDIGTGCGIHAVRLARHARRVVATDLNPRALSFTAFNAALNGASNVELRHGSLWEPVQGESFDQIVANPAFTLSSETEFMFRDGGTRGDRMTGALLAGAAAHLREGGIAQVIGEFPTIGVSSFEEQAQAWVGEAPCDRLLLRLGAMEPVEYAAAYAHQPFGQTREQYEAAMGARLAAFAALGASDVLLGAVLLRRREGGPHWAARRMLPAPERPIGRELGALIERLDRWEAEDAPERLWRAFPRMRDGLRLTEAQDWTAEGWEEAEIRAGVADDLLCQEVRLSGPARDLLTLCDGTRCGQAVAEEFARLHQLSEQEAAEATVAFLRELAEQGLIEAREEVAGAAISA